MPFRWKGVFRYRVTGEGGTSGQANRYGINENKRRGVR